jgi:predicted SAM-dependent methyltransferase
MNKIYLDIGGGEAPKEGFLNVDPFHEKADVKAFAQDLPYKENEVDEIYSSHLLEHLGKWEILPTLKEWLRVLKPSGSLTLRVPDLEWCCRQWLENQDTGWNMDIIFGHQNDKGEFHKTGFTWQILKNYLTDSGFIIDKFEEIMTHSQKTLSFECHKP